MLRFFFHQEIVYSGYPKAVHGISMIYFAWNWSKSFCGWYGGWVGEQKKYLWVNIWPWILNMAKLGEFIKNKLSWAEPHPSFSLILQTTFSFKISQSESQKRILSIKILGQQIVWVQQNLGLNKFGSDKILALTKC